MYCFICVQMSDTQTPSPPPSLPQTCTKTGRKPPDCKAERPEQSYAAHKLRNEGQTDRKKRTRQVTSDTHGRERGKGQGQCATHLYKVKQYSHYLYSGEPYIRPFCFRVQRVIFRKFFYHHSFCDHPSRWLTVTLC